MIALGLLVPRLIIMDEPTNHLDLHSVEHSNRHSRKWRRLLL